MKTASDFIWQVPGEDAEIDAYNLVLATITNHSLWFESVINHQRDAKQLGDVLAVVLAWLELAYAALKPVEREMMLAAYRSVAAKNVDPDKPRSW